MKKSFKMTNQDKKTDMGYLSISVCNEYYFDVS